MHTGLVSNCWHHQLAAGQELDHLIAEADRRGLRIIELRQGCMGSYESGKPGIPNASMLSELPRRFPNMSFNIAMSVPFLRPLAATDSAVLEAGRRAAVAVSGANRPHLRLVDLKSPFEVDRDRAHRNLLDLAQSMKSCDGMLSIEHSLQEWNGLLQAFRSVRATLGEQKNQLRFCFDPCNLKMIEDTIDIASAANCLSLDEISMIHIKQCRHQCVLPDVSAGSVDWQTVGDVLNRKAYRGPMLFEIASTSDIWAQISASVNYLAENQFVLNPGS